MAGETIKTRGIVLDIRPWSQTSHVTTWLTPDHGPVTTLVKGAVRPKSAFLGQYDLFYTCELIYYARASGELHAIREACAENMREWMRGDFRATALASYAAHLVREHCPHGTEAAEWFALLERTLDGLNGCQSLEGALVAFETGFLALAGLSPDFSGADLSRESVPFAIDLGRVGQGTKTVLVPCGAVRLLSDGGAADASATGDAVRFLGLFLRYHIDMPPEIRRNTVRLMQRSLAVSG